MHENVPSLLPGATIIDTTTGDPASAEVLARDLVDRGITYLDATTSGSGAHVFAGSAVMMLGGDNGAVAACADIFSQLARETIHTGGPGTGAKMKRVTNLVLGLYRAALDEGLALGQGLGPDATQALTITRRGPAYSRIMDSKRAKMPDGEFSPEARLSQHLKDVRLVVPRGTEAGPPRPLSIAHQQVPESAEAAGLAALDNSAIIKLLGAARDNAAHP